MKYNNIKKILRHQIKNQVKVLWTWNKELKEFKCIYELYDSSLTIYTPKQLLKKINSQKKIN